MDVHPDGGSNPAVNVEELEKITHLSPLEKDLVDEVVRLHKENSDLKEQVSGLLQKQYELLGSVTSLADQRDRAWRERDDFMAWLKTRPTHG